MKVLFTVLGIAVGIIIAWILNRLLVSKMENKAQRIGLTITSYIVCIILALGFAFIGSLRATLDNFIGNRIKDIGVILSEAFPDSNILEISIDANEFVPISDELQKITDYVDTSTDGFFEKLIYNAFLKRLTKYVFAVKNSVDTMATMGDDNGLITINSILYRLKDMLLNTISPYFLFGQIGVLLLLLVYVGILIFLKKGGATYNKSMVFGDIDYGNSTEKRRTKE